MAIPRIHTCASVQLIAIFFSVVSHHELLERLRYTNILLLLLVKACLRMGSLSICLLDLVHDTRRSLHARIRIDGEKAISRGFSGGKQMIKSANTRSRSCAC